MADEAAPASPAGDKPLPAPRPGTAGTELLLKTNRRDASDAFRRAQEAERAYVARKRSRAAKNDRVEAKSHFAAARKEFLLGIKKWWASIMALPSVLKEKQVEAHKKEEVRQIDLAEKKKEMWEKKMKEREAAEAVKKEEATAEV